MKKKNFLQFLGTGSGAKNMITQDIATSALFFDFGGLKFILDPGPGTLINAKKRKVNLFKINGILISHGHPDHCADINCLLTAFERNTGFLIAAEHCLKPTKQFWPCVSKFHQSIPKIVKAVKPRDKVKINNVTFEATKAKHYGVGMGFKIKGPKIIGYVGDGIYYSGQEKQYTNCDLLIFNVLVPYKYPTHFSEHTNIENVITILKKVKPKLAVIQHYSEKMLDAGVDKQAKIVQKQTGVKTIAAKDGMKINLDKLRVIK